MPTIHDKLNSLMDFNSPKLARFLHRSWKQQQNDITYKELQDAILSGKLDLGWMKQWHQFYSTFVSTYYAPLAKKMAMEAAKNVLQSYGGQLADPMRAGIDKFVTKHGAKLVREVTQMQYEAINTLVKQAALTDTMTVDQLARAIRPCVGLTKRQAQATYNYHDALVKQGYTPEEARKKQAQYAAKMHRRRATTIADTEMAFAYNAGADAVIQSGIDDGLIESGVTKEWSTSADERVCDVCGKLDGVKVSREDPFPGGIALPPAHPNCRCAVLYKDLKLVAPAPPPPAPTPAPPTQQPQAPAQTPAQTQPDPNYVQPEIPDDIQFGPMTYQSSDSWGTGEMHQFTDANGDDWIFKPGQNKKGQTELFRAHVQEAGYKVQAIVDPDTAIPCGTITLDTPKGTKFGALQQKVTDLDTSFNLKDWQVSGHQTLTPDIITQIQKENVTDWLMCNYDGHGGNFVLKKNGTLFGLDKEQAFHYINRPESQAMSYKFHPNQAYGETEPVYNTLYRQFAQGKIDINLQDTLAYIKRVEAIPDLEYREIFRGYAEALHGKGAKAEQLLDMITTRKQTVRKTFEDFYGDLLTERRGKKTAFKFVDQALTAAGQPLQATAMNTHALNAMSLGDLQGIAKTQGIKYAWNMNKGQLVDAISDPSKTAQIVADAKARAYGIGTKPKAPKAPKPAAVPAPAAGKKPRIEGVMQLDEALDDFDAALKGTTIRGTSLISDKSSLEGMQTTLRKVSIDGKEYYELSGKLTEARWLKANTVMIAQQNTQAIWEFERATSRLDYTKPFVEMSSANSRHFNAEFRTIRIGNSTLSLVHERAASDSRAVMGEFRLRIQAANGADAARQARALLTKAQMDDIIENVQADALDRYKKMRLIWQHDPAAAARLDPTKVTDADLTNVLGRLGISQQRIDAMKLYKVTDGYFTFIDNAAAALIDQKGVAYLWNGVDGKSAAIAIIESGELISSTTRMKRGILTGGASVDFDFKSGGADSVFTRVAMKQDVGVRQFGSSFNSGDYQFIFDKKALTRTDWYGYNHDLFGTTEASAYKSRSSVSDLLDTLGRYYNDGNEVMFRKSLGFEFLKEIRCGSQREVDELIAALNARGITKIRGKDLKKVIKVGGGTL